MHVDEVITRLLAVWPNALIGRGPEHPIEPNIELKSVVSEWILIHSFLIQDKGYVDFLKRYAGAQVDLPDEKIGLYIG